MPSRNQLRQLIDQTSRIKQYFLRGHNSWFALVFSILNFTLIFYKLLLESLDFLPESLRSYAVFFVLFSAVYFPLSTILGYFDIKKGTFAAEQTLSKEYSPVWLEVFERLSRLEQSDLKILESLSKVEKGLQGDKY